MIDINMKTTATISPDKIIEYVKIGLIGDGLEMVSEPKFKTGTRCEGHGMMERDVHYFDGCTVDVRPITNEHP